MLRRASDSMEPAVLPILVGLGLGAFGFNTGAKVALTVGAGIWGITFLPKR